MVLGERILFRVDRFGNVIENNLRQQESVDVFQEVEVIESKPLKSTVFDMTIIVVDSRKD